MLVLVDAITIEAADSYFATRFNSEAWSTLDDATKLSLLVTASNLLGSLDWLGRPASLFSIFPSYLPTSTLPITPPNILLALYEMALHLLSNPTLLGEEGHVETLVVGPIQLQKMEKVKLYPTLVKRLISAYTRGSGTGVTDGGRWWRAN